MLRTQALSQKEIEFGTEFSVHEKDYENILKILATCPKNDHEIL